MLAKIVESYKSFLSVKYESHYKLFCNRLGDKPEGARAEAVTFSWLRSQFEEVTIAEDVVTGGADFLCVSGNDKIIVEVTCAESEAVSTQSYLPNRVPENGSGGSFRMITHKLRTKASEKASQLSDYRMPRVLAITCEHVAADVLLGPLGAEMLLTSDPKIRVPIATGKSIDERIYMTTDLKDSVFFRFNKGTVEPCRQSISAIFLISILADKLLVVGILHPQPRHVLTISMLPLVPFLRIKKWPPENHRIETEWVIHSPKPAAFYHQEITFNEKELRSI
ncbi:hypothetical protein Calab_2169 [Caldithrix abyssi DSM 13497]|uniref:Uncharacterized protein n=1 Tax=Caldithrix abyssi DSM 13497 TaxID=880073 RepID=H1XW07_CALAY|nr:hypothetical protein [Caldithrix abyssi]APF17697.1 hypothetical protein Cabys_946 [Caldithrix abyssi DSM 13497]EHO41779.1 hypothetical protein Calab_2169 [Caldithrix abyssi DSM 13497]